MNILFRTLMLMVVGSSLAACRIFEPDIQTMVVTQVVKETQVVTLEVTRIVKETVIITATPNRDWHTDISPGNVLSSARTWHTATMLQDGQVLLVGGSNGVDDHYATVEFFNPEGGFFSEAADMWTPRSGHTATHLMDDRVLVIGGYNAAQGWLADAEVYDPATDSWTVLPPIFSHGVQHTATLLADGRVLVVGGCVASGLCVGDAELFDPQTNLWSEAAPFPAPRASHFAVLLDDGQVLLAGGDTEDDGTLIYDPVNNAWLPASGMAINRAQAQTVKLPDGRVLVAGGLTLDGAQAVLKSAEIYDPAADRWNEVEPLPQPRYGQQMALLPDGHVLAVGGALEYDFPAGYPGGSPWSDRSFVLEVSAYFPATNRWYQAGTLPLPTAHGALVSLRDGRFWLSGGGAGNAVASALPDTWLIRMYLP